MCRLYANTTFSIRDLSPWSSGILRGPGNNSLSLLRTSKGWSSWSWEGEERKVPQFTMDSTFDPDSVGSAGCWSGATDKRNAVGVTVMADTEVIH